MTRSVYLNVPEAFKHKKSLFGTKEFVEADDLKSEQKDIDEAYCTRVYRQSTYDESQASWLHFQWKRNIWALVPMLDLCNHSPATEVR